VFVVIEVLANGLKDGSLNRVVVTSF